MRSLIGIFSIAFLMLGAGCATPSNELSLKKITPQQRVYLGRVQVNLNGDQSPKCEIYLNYDIAPSIKLSNDGFIFYKTDRENLKLNKIACLHKASKRMSAWHHQELFLSPVVRTSDNQEATYFGDIHINWKIDADETLTAAARDLQAGVTMKEGHVKNSGELKIDVQNNQENVEKAFFGQNPEAVEKGLLVKAHIVEVKKD